MSSTFLSSNLVLEVLFLKLNFLHNQNVLNLEDKFMDYCVHLEG